MVNLPKNEKKSLSLGSSILGTVSFVCFCGELLSRFLIFIVLKILFFQQNRTVIGRAFTDTYGKDCRSRNRLSIGSPDYNLQNYLGKKQFIMLKSTFRSLNMNIWVNTIFGEKTPKWCKNLAQNVLSVTAAK